jgi:hypothetical protein
LNARFPYISFKANLKNMKEVGLEWVKHLKEIYFC